MEIYGGPAKRIRRKDRPPNRVDNNNLSTTEQVCAQKRAQTLAAAGLPARIANNLEAHNIFTVDDLTKLSREQLLNIPNLGQVTLQRCVTLLDTLGLPHQLGACP